MSNRILRAATVAGGVLASVAFGLGIVHSTLAQTGQSGMPAADSAPSSTAAPAIPMEQVFAELKAQGYGEIYEIERERDKYEVKARNKEGRVVELYLDAATGQVLEIEDD